MHAKLIIVGGKANRSEIRLKLPSIVGRSRNAGVVIAHPMVSRQHCELYEEGGQIHVRDLGSLNGTIVNDDQVQRAVVEHGARLTVGPLTFRMAYDHLGPLPDLIKTDDDSAIGQAIAPPELAQTVVDLRRVSPVEVDFRQAAEPSAVKSAPLADDGFDLGPTTDEPEVSRDKTIQLPAPPTKDSDSLKLFDSGDEDDFLSAPDVAAIVEADALPTVELSADEDDLSFDLSPADDIEMAVAPTPTAESPAVESASADVEDEVEFDLSPPDDMPAPVAQAPVVDPPSAVDDDPFLAMIGDETGVTMHESPPTSLPEEAETVAVELSVDAPAPAKAEVEDELDWLAGDAAESAPDDLTDLAATMQAGQAEDAAIEELEFGEAAVEEVEELNFDEAPSAAPIAGAPPADVAPAKPAKENRGLWPFGRKKKKEVAEAAPQSTDDVVSIASDETIVMDPTELVAALGKHEAPAEAIDLSSGASAEVEELSFDEPAASEPIVEEAAEPVPALDKPKRGFFSFGRKKKETAAAPEVVAAPKPLVEEVVAEAEMVPAAEAPGKKRGWFGLGKKDKKAKSAEAPPAAEAPAPQPTRQLPAPHIPTAAPSPESFEFSEAELEEITAETAPAKPVDMNGAQALAADEVLDFELDLPLEESGASIQPVVSDAPAPSTGADDDDFLDFLAEELPGAKPKRGG